MADHAHSDHGEHGEHGEHSDHVLPKRVLLGTWGALMVLTVLTVAVTRVNFGGDWSLGVAMIIAVCKATLVVLFFMHLRYDRTFHAVILVAGILAATLFVGFALMDRGQYENAVIWDKDKPPAAPLGPAPPFE